MYFVKILNYKLKCLQHLTDSPLALESSFFNNFVPSAPAGLVEAETESGQAKESFQPRNKKPVQYSRLMNNILVILTGNYVTT